MKINIIKIVIIGLFITGCGDTGEKFADAVKKIRGENTKIISKQQLDEIIETNGTNKNKSIKQSSNSLKDIALKAKEDIKDAMKPANELKNSIKNALSITKESVKEIVTEKKEIAKESIIKVKEMVKGTKEKLKADAKEIKNLIETDKKSVLDK